MKRWVSMALLLGTAACLTACGEDKNAEKKDAYRQIGFRCMETGDYEGAVEAFQNALDQSAGAIGEEEIDTCYYKAAALYDAGKPEEARQIYESLLAYDETNADAAYLLGNLYLVQGNGEKAKQFYDQAARYAGNNYELYVGIYNQVIGAGYPEEAERYLRQALNNAGKTGYDYVQRGRIYLLLKDYDHAQEQLDEASDKKHEDAPLYLAELYEVKGETEKAQLLYQAYAENHENNPEALNRLATMKLELDDYEGAVNYLKLILDANENLLNDQELRRELIYAYEQLLDFSSARTAMEEYLRRYPDDSVAAREYEFLQTR